MSISKELGKIFMSPEITVDICTVGGCDDNGNEVEEPTVFDGRYLEAEKFFTNENNLSEIDEIYNNMPDGYIIVTVGNFCREIYDVHEIMNTIEEMLY